MATTIPLTNQTSLNQPRLMDNTERLNMLRLQETEYTEEELNFMYMMHNQDYYKRENLQNPECIEDMKQKVNVNHRIWKKHTISNLDNAKRKIFDEIREELDNDGLMHVSNDQIMRAMYVTPAKKKCLEKIRNTEQVRVKHNLNDLQESDFEYLIQMKCFAD